MAGLAPWKAQRQLYHQHVHLERQFVRLQKFCWCSVFLGSVDFRRAVKGQPSISDSSGVLCEGIIHSIAISLHASNSSPSRVKRVFTSSSFESLSATRCGRGLTPTMKYVGSGMCMFPARSSVTVSSSSANRSPTMMAKEKLLLVWPVVSFLASSENWPLTSPKTIL